MHKNDIHEFGILEEFKMTFFSKVIENKVICRLRHELVRIEEIEKM